MTRYVDDDTEEFPLPSMQCMTVKTTMKVTNWSKDTIYDLLAADAIKSFLVGSRRYIDGASVRDYIKRRSAEELTLRRSPKPRAKRSLEPRTGPGTGPGPPVCRRVAKKARR